jgi:pimeloyl-ACP methyl ester carboxylesterase
MVVLEAGAGNDAKTWRDVLTPIAQFAHVCAYDRQGLGSSERTSGPQGIVDVVDTLHALLGSAAEPPPYVMAGHSWGGPLVRLYATRYPVEVRGMVLIDSSHEDQVKRFAALDADPTPADPPRPGAEQIDLEGMAREMTKAPWHANIPLVVLTHAPLNDEPGDPHGAIWQELQRELATRSPQAEQIVAQRAGHYIQNQEPGLVIDAVRRVVAKATR